MFTALVLIAPWLLALAWALRRWGLGLRDSEPPSMADEAQRRLSVR